MRHILNVFPQSPFFKQYLAMLKNDGLLSGHRFIVYGQGERDAEYGNASIEFLHEGVSKLAKGFILIRGALSSRMIIIHGLQVPGVTIAFALFPALLRKTCWALWGWDLYQRKLAPRGPAFWLLEFFRSRFIRRVAAITTTVPGDYQLARRWYGAKARYIENILYASHVARPTPRVSAREIGPRPLRIQIGNSADPANGHKELIDRLAGMPDIDFLVYAPLSYGDPDNAAEVAGYGARLLGKRFIPLLKLMGFEEYTAYLSDIDLAIFNHKRQQAMGNIIGLLSLGKKVYIRSDISPWPYFKGKGFELFDTKLAWDLSPLSAESAEKNIKAASSAFNETALSAAWQLVFSGAWRVRTR